MIDIERFRKLSGSAPIEGLATIPDWAIPALKEAHRRYLAFSGVLDTDDSQKAQMWEDRIKFKHLYLTPASDGIPIIDSDKQVEFMHLVSGLSKQWCITWSYAEWVDRIVSSVNCDREQSLNLFPTAH
jgi:hypothetical protein